MQSKTFEEDVDVVKQGDDGDLFYVVEEAVFELTTCKMTHSNDIQASATFLLTQSAASCK